MLENDIASPCWMCYTHCWGNAAYLETCDQHCAYAALRKVCVKLVSGEFTPNECVEFTPNECVEKLRHVLELIDSGKGGTAADV